MRHKTNSILIKKITYTFFLYAFFVLCPIVIISTGSSKVINSPVLFADQTPKEENKKEESEKEQQNKQKGGLTAKEPAKAREYNYKQAEKEEQSYGGLIFRAFLVIALMIGGFVLFFRFITKKSGLPRIGRDVVQVLAIAPLSHGKFIQIVDIAGKVMVLGITDNNINMITEIKDKEEIDRIKLESSKSLPASGLPTGNFQEFVKEQIGNFTEKMKNKQTKQGNNKIRRNSKNFSQHKNDDLSDDRLDFLRNQKKRLKKLNGHDDE
jgi:flagellar biogenesis protein FliO